MDFTGPLEGMMVLVLLDSLTKWMEAIPLKQATTTTATTYCLRDIFSWFGVPRTIVSDNGAQLISHEFGTFIKQNMSHVMTAPFHTQPNWTAKRAV